MTDRRIEGWAKGKIMLLSHILTMSGRNAISLVKSRLVF